MGVSYYLLQVPMYSGMSTSRTVSIDGSGTSNAPGISEATLLEVNGTAAVYSLSIPVLLAVLALLAPASARTRAAGLAAGLVGLFSLVGSWTVGLFHAPGALLLLIGALLPERNQAQPA